MRLSRVYVAAPLETGAVVALGTGAAAHVSRVLRLRSGEPLTLFNGAGGEYSARIQEAHAGRVTVAVGELSTLERESPLHLTLAQGISRGERMDLVVQKATELGVAALQPLFTERSVVRLGEQQADRKMNHWRAIVIGACEQSGRNRLPQLTRPAALGDFVRGPDGATRVLLSPGASRRLADLPRATRVTVLVGPEGGLTDAEEEAAVAAGFAPLRLGPRVLRTETAAIAALALLQREWGDL